jgi:vancomycin resistance protein YoaR
MIPDYKKKLQLMPRAQRLGIYFLLGALLTAGFLPLFTYGLFSLRYQGLIHPGVVVAGIPLGGLSEADAAIVLETAVETYIENSFPIVFSTEEHEFSLDFEPSWATYHISDSANRAFTMTRDGGWVEKAKTQWQAFTQTKELPMVVSVDEVALESFLASMSAELAVKPVAPTIELVEKSTGEKELLLDAGVSGTEVDRETILLRLRHGLTLLEPTAGTILMKEVGTPATEAMMRLTRERGERLIDKSLRLLLPQEETEASLWMDVELIELMTFDGSYDQDKLAANLERLGVKIFREPVDAKFQFDENQHRVKEFIPAVSGQTLLVDESMRVIMAALSALEREGERQEVELVVDITHPDVRLETVNNLGITELLGTGYSTYKGSIASRVYNVALAAERINGTLIKPGEVFSFNKAIGEISGATGYQKAYIIINGRTELDDGGGVCQVSTTVFRAALDAGLPITERRAHAYRVSYYEQGSKAGFDATIYSPTTDFKFLNDTEHHILIQTVVDSPARTLAIHFYGTSDGRRAEINNHEVWAITPPPPDVYQDDPTLPAGTIKQVEHKVAGAKAKFDYVVYRGDEIIHEKTFYSSFKPWAAVYLRGTAQ